jgi:hypothetical protein
MSPFLGRCQDLLYLQYCLVPLHTRSRLSQSIWAGSKRSWVYRYWVSHITWTSRNTTDSLVRLVLAALFSASLHHLCRSISFRFGAQVKWWFLIFTLSSFHIPYYAGRTIPNFMALPLGKAPHLPIIDIVMCLSCSCFWHLTHPSIKWTFYPSTN